jgi:hypothetical protein
MSHSQCHNAVHNERHRHIGVVSCNKISTMKEIGLWEDLAKKTHDLDCILHMGDQVFLTGFHGYFRNLNVFLVSLCRACVR